MGVLRRYSWPAGFAILAAGMAVFLWMPERWVWGWTLSITGSLLVGAGAALNFRDLAALARGRGVRHGTNAVLYTLIVLLIVAAVNFLAARHRARVDLTEGGVHTLSPQTLRILEGLDEDVDVIGFYTDGSLDRRTDFEDLAAEYAHRSPRVRIRAVDPLRSPGEARLHEIVQDGTIVVKAASGEARLTTVGEQDLTNAILKATRKERPAACFTTGHGEHSTGDAGAKGLRQAAEALEQDNFETRDLLHLRETEVPAACALVVVAGPSTPLHASEAGLLDRYLASGGRLMVLKRDPQADTGLEDLLARYGLKVNRDTVVDRLSRAIIGDEFTPVVTSYEPHPVTGALGDRGMATCFPVASSVETTPPVEAGITSSVIARTTEAAWGETSQIVGFEREEYHPGPIGIVAAASGAVPGTAASDAHAGEAAPDGSEGAGEAGPREPAGSGPGGAPRSETAEEGDDGPGAAGDQPGGASPVPAEAEGDGAGAEGAAPRERRIVLFGDGDFASNAYLRAGFANADLFLNAAAWLAEQEDLISIRPPRKEARPITLTRDRAALLSGMTYLVPLVAFVGAVLVWSRRKRL